MKPALLPLAALLALAGVLRAEYLPPERFTSEQFAQVRAAILASLEGYRQDIRDLARKFPEIDPKKDFLLIGSSADREAFFELKDQALRNADRCSLDTLFAQMAGHGRQPESDSGKLVVSLGYANGVEYAKKPNVPPRLATKLTDTEIAPGGVKITAGAAATLPGQEERQLKGFLAHQLLIPDLQAAGNNLLLMLKVETNPGSGPKADALKAALKAKFEIRATALKKKIDAILGAANDE